MADTLPQVAVMVAVPTATAVTLPLASTVATFASEVLHVTVLSVVDSGRTVADRVSVSVALRVMAVLSRVMESAIVATTFIVIVELTSPQVTVIIASPTPTAVTLPSASTVATELSDEVNVTLGFVVVDGLTVTTSFVLSPARKVDVDTFISTLSAGVASTVTAQVADTLPQVAVMVAVPTATAVTLPLASIVATFASEVLHSITLTVVVAGSTVAVSVSV